MDQCTLELSKRPHDREQQVRHWRVLPCEDKVLFQKLYFDTTASELLHQAPEIVEIACQPVHTGYHYGVSLTHKGQIDVLRPEMYICTQVTGNCLSCRFVWTMDHRFGPLRFICCCLIDR